MFESIGTTLPVFYFFFEVALFLFRANLLVIHALDGILKRADAFLLGRVPLIVFVQLGNNLAQILLLLLDVHLVALQVVVLLLFEFVVELLVQASNRIVQLLVDPHDRLLFLGNSLLSHRLVIIVVTTTHKHTEKPARRGELTGRGVWVSIRASLASWLRSQFSSALNCPYLKY